MAPSTQVARFGGPDRQKEFELIRELFAFRECSLNPPVAERK